MDLEVARQGWREYEKLIMFLLALDRAIKCLDDYLRLTGEMSADMARLREMFDHYDKVAARTGPTE